MHEANQVVRPLSHMVTNLVSGMAVLYFVGATDANFGLAAWRLQYTAQFLLVVHNSYCNN